MFSSISMVSKGVSRVCSEMGMLCGMGAIGCVRGGFVAEGMLVRAAYDIGVCSERSAFFMYACHEGCMSDVFGMGSLGSLRCFVPAERSRMDRRVSMSVRSCSFGWFFCLWVVWRGWRLWVVCGM